MPQTLLGPIRAMWRGSRLRCPLCGASWPRTGWVRLAPRCASCALRADRGESDYFIGSYTLSLLGSLAAAVGIAVVAVWFPSREWWIYALAVPGLTGLAIWLHPVCRLVWLAVDLQFRPAVPKDFDRS